MRLQSPFSRLPSRPAVPTQARCQRMRPQNGRLQMAGSAKVHRGRRFMRPALLTSIPAEGNRCAGPATVDWAFGRSCPFGRVSAQARRSMDRRDCIGSVRVVPFASRALTPLSIANARSQQSSMAESIKPRRIPVVISSRHLTSPPPNSDADRRCALQPLNASPHERPLP